MQLWRNLYGSCTCACNTNIATIFEHCSHPVAQWACLHLSVSESGLYKPDLLLRLMEPDSYSLSSDIMLPFVFIWSYFSPFHRRPFLPYLVPISTSHSIIIIITSRMNMQPYTPCVGLSTTNCEMGAIATVLTTGDFNGRIRACADKVSFYT